MHSIGSLETWEPEDKSFTKHILKPGTGESHPNEGSVVSVSITPLGTALTHKFHFKRHFYGGGCMNECEVPSILICFLAIRI